MALTISQTPAKLCCTPAGELQPRDLAGLYEPIKVLGCIRAA